MANAKFTPTEMNLAKMKTPPTKLSSTGLLSDSDFGGRTTNRTMKIDGDIYQVCFLNLDSEWDISAAIIAYEMNRFQPHAVMMTGRGNSPTFEDSAINQTTKLPGYNSAGKISPLNQPAQMGSRLSRVLPANQPGVLPRIKMTWNNTELAAATATLIADLGFTVQAARGPTDGNNHICNNVSFVALHAAKSIPLKLAGGAIVLHPKLARVPRVGFFHFAGASDLDAVSVFEWSKVMATSVRTILNPETKQN